MQLRSAFCALGCLRLRRGMRHVCAMDAARRKAVALFLFAASYALTADSQFHVSVCGGFSDGGLPEACCWPESISMALAKLAWDRNQFEGTPGKLAVLQAPPGGKQNFTLDLNIMDVEGDAGKGLVCAMEEWQKDNLLIIAAGWSSLSMPIAMVGPTVGGLQLDWSGSTPTLSDKTRFGYYSRIIPSDDAVAMYMARLLVNTWGYKRLLIVYERGDYGLPIFQKFIEQVPVEVVTEIVALPAKPLEIDKPALRLQLSTAAKRQMRIGVMFVLEAVTYQVFSEPNFTKILLGPGYLWFGTGDLIATGFKAITGDTISRFKGTICVSANMKGSEERRSAWKDFVMTLSAADFSFAPLVQAVIPCEGGYTLNRGANRSLPATPDECWWGGNGVFSSPGDMLDVYSSVAFDAVSAVFFMINRLVAAGTDPKSLAKKDLIVELRKTMFEGLTGRVAMNDAGDRIPGSFLLTSIEGPGTYTDVASFDPLSGVVNWIAPVNYSDGTRNRPADTFPECPKGQYRDYLIAQCVPCGKGQYNPFLGATVCMECAPGYFNNLAGVSACTPCSLGMFQEEAGSFSCTNCTAGSSQSSPGSSNCQACELGKYQGQLGTTSCGRCAKASFSDTPGSRTCKTCPVGRTTDGIGFTKVDDCMCPPNYYEFQAATTNSSTLCVQCGVGAMCGGFSEPPTAVPGYHLAAVLVSGLSIFTCQKDTKRCPGGMLGTCAKGRKGPACSECLDGYTPGDNGECKPCGGSIGYLPTAVVIALYILVLTGLYISVRRQNRAKQSHTLLTVMASAAQCFGLVQMLGVMGRISVTWESPLSDFMIGMKIFTFDLEPLNVGCVGTLSPLKLYVVKILMAPIGLIYLSALHFFIEGCGPRILVFFRQKQSKKPDALFGAGGMLMTGFFIAICITIFSPFQCVKHPNGKYTILQYPSQLCWEGGDHTAMIIIGLVSLSFPFNYLAFVGYLVRCLPRRLRKGDTDFLDTYSFLFSRVKLSCTWFMPAYLIRNLLASIIPAIDGTFWQVTLMQTLFMIALAVTCGCWPWRLPIINAVEVACIFALLRVVSLGAFLDQQGPVGSGTMTQMTMVVFCFVLGIMSVIIVFGCWATFGGRMKPIKYLLVHNKVESGSFARLLKMMLGGPATDTAIIDNDIGGNFDSLLNTVATKVQKLVVLCTPEVFFQPTCVGQVARAFLNGVSVLPVVFPEFHMPDRQLISTLEGVVPVGMITQGGVSIINCKDALGWFSTLPFMTLPRAFAPATARCLVKALHASSLVINSSDAEFHEQVPLMDVDVIINVDSENREAVAAAMLLQLWISRSPFEESRKLVPALFDVVQKVGYKGLPWGSIQRKPQDENECNTFIFLCTKGCFFSATYLRGLVFCREAGVRHVVPVAVGEEFRLPNRAFYDRLASEGHRLTHLIPAHLCAYVQEIFTKLCVPFTTTETNEIIDVQVSVVKQRVAEGPNPSSRKTRLDALSNAILSISSSILGGPSKTKSSEGTGSLGQNTGSFGQVPKSEDIDVEVIEVEEALRVF
jgi:hypothetical protein